MAEERATFVSQVSFAPTKPFTDAFPQEADKQQEAFETPSYAQVKEQPKFHLPKRLLEDNPLLKKKEVPPTFATDEILPLLVIGAVVFLGAIVIWKWTSGATSTSP